MHSKRFSLTIGTLSATLVAVFLLTGFGNVAHDKNYDCAGKNDNGMVSFREFPMLHFSGRGLKITRSDVFTGFNYEICDETDALVSFATGPEVCRLVPAAIKSLRASNGSLNKITGRLQLFGAQELHGEYECKEILKK